MLIAVSIIILLLASATYWSNASRSSARLRNYSTSAVALVLAISALFLSIPVRDSAEFGDLAVVYLSTMEADLLRAINDCWSSQSERPRKSVCTKRYRRLEVVVSKGAETAAMQSGEHFWQVRTSAYENPITDSGPGTVSYGLTLNDSLKDLKSMVSSGRLPAAAFVVAPRTADKTEAISEFGKLTSEQVSLADSLSIVSPTDLGVQSKMYLELSAPSSVSAQSKSYDVSLSIRNEGRVSFELQAKQVLSGTVASGRERALSLRPLGKDRWSLTAAEESEQTFASSAANLDVSGTLAPAAIRQSSLASVVIRNSYGESIAERSAVTLTEQPTLGVLQLDVPNQPTSPFLQFCRGARIDARPVRVNLREEPGSTPERARSLREALATDLAKWGLIVVDTPLTESEGKFLTEALATPPKTGSPPAIIFVGAGNQPVYPNTADAAIAGWAPFLSTLGIKDFSPSRKIGVAVDESQSIEYSKPSVNAAVGAMYNKEAGLGARNSGWIQFFCRQGGSGSECDVERFLNRGEGVGSYWEGNDHLSVINEYAKRNGVVVDGKLRYVVTDLLLFWDARDIAGPPPCKGCDHLLRASGQQALTELLNHHVKLYIVSFDRSGRSVDAGAGQIKGFEVISNFTGNTVTKFQSDVLPAIVPRLRVGISDLTLISDGVKNQLELGSAGVNLANSFLSPLSSPAIRSTGSTVVLRVEHPDGFSAPLFVLNKKSSIGEPQKQVVLTVGYLALDVPSEVADVKYASDSKRDATAGLIVSVMNSMGGSLRSPPLQWLLSPRKIQVTREDQRPFLLGPTSLAGEVRRAGQVEPVARFSWNQKSLLNPAMEISPVGLGDDSDVLARLCYFESATEASPTSSCGQPSSDRSVVEVSLPVVRPIPIPLEESEYSEFSSAEKPSIVNSEMNRFSVSKSVMGAIIFIALAGALVAAIRA